MSQTEPIFVVVGPSGSCNWRGNYACNAAVKVSQGMVKNGQAVAEIVGQTTDDAEVINTEMDGN